MVTVSLDRSHLSARLAAGKRVAGYALAEQILGDCRPFTPHAEGTLEASGRAGPYENDHAVTWETVYAAYQYYGCWPDGTHVINNHNHDTNAKATTMWCEAARAEYQTVWDDLAQKKFTEGAGG